MTDSLSTKNQENYRPKGRMDVSWYIKLNIMVMGFLFVLFLIQKIQSPVFQAGLGRIFTNPATTHTPPSGRVAKIQPKPTKPSSNKQLSAKKGSNKPLTSP